MEGLAAYNILIKPLVNKRKREEEDDFEIEKRRKVLNDECDHVSMVTKWHFFFFLAGFNQEFDGLPLPPPRGGWAPSP